MAHSLVHIHVGLAHDIELPDKLVELVLHYAARLLFQAEDGIRDVAVTGVQTCALPISQSVSSSMLMFMARRELEHAALGVHVMASTDPLMGASGYPLLFQTGETANGRDPLIDRQHPHDLLMEAAATYSLNLRPQTSLFVYAGLPGEPALGPTAFMHRLSGMDEPEAPLSHHWLDSTHISFGVVTGGCTWRQLRLEASRFNGREPDQHRYDIEVRALDSYAARMSYNPTRDWALQGRFGRPASPEH